MKVPQIENVLRIEIRNLKFTNSNPPRKDFILSANYLKFEIGDIILVKGESGAGKSTFYDIISGIIPYYKYDGNILINEMIKEYKFHHIESTRIILLQDNNVDFESTCYEIITGSDDDKKLHPDQDIWQILQIIKMNNFFVENFSGNIHIPLEKKLSGGQKMRLQLGKMLFRLINNDKSALILDEPDKGLPDDITIEIINNIITFYKNKGIMFLTLHSSKVEELNFTKILNVKDGDIKLEV